MQKIYSFVKPRTEYVFNGTEIGMTDSDSEKTGKGSCTSLTLASALSTPPPPPPDDVTSQMTTALIIFRDKDSLPLQARQLPLNSSRLKGSKTSVFDTGGVNYQPRIVRKLDGEFNFQC